tara:strand:- start:407 stop:751 length:345 start_codon:yes stop_codon:yes gene_type:complete
MSARTQTRLVLYTLAQRQISALTNLEGTTAIVTKLLYRVATVPQTLFIAIMVQLRLARETRVVSVTVLLQVVYGVEQIATFVIRLVQVALSVQHSNLRQVLVFAHVRLFLSRIW